MRPQVPLRSADRYQQLFPAPSLLLIPLYPRMSSGVGPGWSPAGLCAQKVLKSPRAPSRDGCWFLSISFLHPECPYRIFRDSFSRLVPGDFPTKGPSPSWPPLFCVLHACTLIFGVSVVGGFVWVMRGGEMLAVSA